MSSAFASQAPMLLQAEPSQASALHLTAAFTTPPNLLTVLTGSDATLTGLAPLYELSQLAASPSVFLYVCV